MRLPHLRPDRLNDAQRLVYEALTTGERSQMHTSMPAAVQIADQQGRLQGPFNAMLHQPEVGMALQELSRTLRFGHTLTPRTREIVILTVAAHERSDFEWAAHAEIARTMGISPAEIDGLARGELVAFADPAENAAATLAHSLATTGDADDDTYARTQSVLGDAATVTVSTTVGVYQLLAQQMRLFRVDAPPGPW